MAQFFLCDENETTAAKNKCDAYTDYLIRSIETYASILTELSSHGIQDDLVSGKLNETVLKLLPYKWTLNSVEEETVSAVTGGISEIEQSDTFHFPSTNAMDVLRILSDLM